MDTEFLIYKPGSAAPESRVFDLPGEPGYDALMSILRPMLDGARAEHVTVLFEGKRADMFVDETGAQFVGARPPLPINAAATAIYHAASIRRGADMPQKDRDFAEGLILDLPWRIWAIPAPVGESDPS